MNFTTRISTSIFSKNINIPVSRVHEALPDHFIAFVVSAVLAAPKSLFFPIQLPYVNRYPSSARNMIDKNFNYFEKEISWMLFEFCDFMI